MTMRIYTDPAALDSTHQRGVLCIGNFDGVHRGHHALLERTIALARTQSAPALVYTFNPHPSQVLAPDAGVVLLQPLAQRLDTLATWPLDAAVVQAFTPAFAALTADAFVETILHQQLRARHIVVGHDFTFGHKRSGTTASLQQRCATHGIGCDIVPPVFLGDLLVSSTYIRRCVAAGRMDDAAAALARPYALIGAVVRGRGIGKQLGFPTLNMVPENALLPPAGVYISSAAWDDAPRAASSPAATYIGTVPTFGGTTLVVETYLLRDTPPDGLTQLRVELHRHIRGDVRFESAEQLKTQIAHDVAAAQAFHA